jgi:Ni/Co efflux regulator RcnB
MKKEKKSFARQAAEGATFAILALTGIGQPIAQSQTAPELKVQAQEMQAKNQTPAQNQSGQNQVVIKNTYNPEKTAAIQRPQAWKTLSRFKQQKQFKKYSRKK